jgi:cell division protein FtsQ
MARKKSKQPVFRTTFSRLIWLWQKYVRPVFFSLLALIIFIWLGAWLWLGGHIDTAKDFTVQQYHHVTKNMGFVVKTVLIEGRHYTDTAELKAAIAIKPDDPLLSFALSDVKKQVEKISWVRSARIERRFPSTLYIQLTEREPAAIWAYQNKKTLIDRQGVVLARGDLEIYDALIEVYGENADKELDALLEMLESAPQIYKRVKIAALVQNRRWDFILDNGVRVQLPEEDIGVALATLVKAQANDGLLERDVSIVDLRQQGRIIIKAKAEAEDNKE